MSNDKFIPINDENITPQINDPVRIFPDDLNKKFEEYSSTVAFKDLPHTQYLIKSTRTFTTDDGREAMVLELFSRNNLTYSAYAPNRLRNELLAKPDTYKFIKHMGLRKSNKTGKEYYDFRLA